LNEAVDPLRYRCPAGQNAGKGEGRGRRRLKKPASSVRTSPEAAAGAAAHRL